MKVIMGFDLNKIEKLKQEGKYQELIKILQPFTAKFKNSREWENYVDACNHLGDTYTLAGNLDAALHCLNDALQIGQKKLSKNHPLIAKTNSWLGNAYFYCDDLTNTIYSYQEALKILSINKKENTKDIVRLQGNLGLCWREKGDSKKALKHLKSVLDFFSQTENYNPQYIAITYNNIGLILNDASDYYNALIHYQKALQIHSSKTAMDKHLTASILSNMGLTHWNIRTDFQTALEFHFSALSIRQEIHGKAHIEVTNSYNNIAICYSEMKIYDKAIDYHLKAIPIQLAHQNPLLLTQSYHNIATCYEELGNLNLALKYHEKGKNLLEDKFGERSPYTIKSYNLIAKHFHKFQKNYKQALFYYQKSLKYNLPENKKLTHDGDSTELFQNCLTSTNLLKTLDFIALCLYDSFCKDSISKHLFESYAYYSIAHQLITYLHQSFKLEESKLTLSRIAQTIYLRAIEVSLKIADLYKPKILVEKPLINWEKDSDYFTFFSKTKDYRHQAWNYAESSKSFLLFSNIKDTQAKLKTNIPPTLLDKEYNLQTELSYLNKRIKEETYKDSSTRNDTKILQWQSQFFDYKQEYDNLIQLFETEYPQYYQLKYDLQTVGISDVQERLGEKSALVEYAIGEKQIYVFLITKTSYTVHSLEKNNSFEKLVEDLCRLVKQSNPNPRRFAAKSHELYQAVFAPIAERIEAYKHLIIIPDGILAKLPFEILLTELSKSNTSYIDLKYLLQKHVIQYHFSATLWAKSAEFHLNTNTPTKSFFGFAPVYASKTKTVTNTSPPNQAQALQIEEKLQINTSNLANRNQRQEFQTEAGILRSLKVGNTTYKELQFSETEVIQVSQLFENNGHKNLTCLHSQATLQQLKTHIAQFQYVLLSTHADYDDQRPDLTGIICSPAIEGKEAFGTENTLDEFDLTDEYVLYMPDVYHLRLHADLVVLSCCESGIGKIAKGEGMMALNRGFLFAGAKNVIHTLFKVYDKQSSKLTLSLFKGIIEKNLTYNEALRQAKLQLIQKGYLPLHWAGFVLIGG